MHGQLTCVPAPPPLAHAHAPRSAAPLFQDAAAKPVRLHQVCRDVVRYAARKTRSDPATPKVDRKRDRTAAGTPQRATRQCTKALQPGQCVLCRSDVNDLHVGSSKHVVSYKNQALLCERFHPGGWPYTPGKGKVCSTEAVRMHAGVEARRAGGDADPEWTEQVAEDLRLQQDLDGVPDLLAYKGRDAFLYHVRCLHRFESGKDSGRSEAVRRAPTNFKAGSHAGLRFALDRLFKMNATSVPYSQFESWMQDGVDQFNEDRPGVDQAHIYARDTALRKVAAAFANEIHVDRTHWLLIKLAAVSADIAAGAAAQMQTPEQCADRFADLCTNQTNLMPCGTRHHFPNLSPDIGDHMAEVPPLVARFLSRYYYRKKVTELGAPQQLVVSFHGQNMRSVATPRTHMCIAPLPHARALCNARRFKSKYLTKTDSKFGIGPGCKQVRDNERALAVNAETLLVIQGDVPEGGSAKFGFDNADQISSTRDGASLHRMGGAMFTNAALACKTNVSFRLARTHYSAADMEASCGGPKRWTFPGSQRYPPSFKCKPLSTPVFEDPLGFIVELGTYGRYTGKPVAQLEFARRAHAAPDLDVVADGVIVLPMIDQNPGDKIDGINSVYSSFKYAASKLKALKLVNKQAAFDLPLYMKSLLVLHYAGSPNPTAPGGVNDVDIASFHSQIGLFHVVLSAFNAAGHVIDGSGFPKALETSFGKGTVAAIMKGKNYNRGARAHDLLSTTLQGMLQGEIEAAPEVPAADKLNAGDKAFVQQWHGQLLSDPAAGREAATPQQLARLARIVGKTKRATAIIAKRGRNARFTLAYVEVIRLIQAVCRGCRIKALGAAEGFNLVRHSLLKLHVVLAACGCLHYVKGLHL